MLLAVLGLVSVVVAAWVAPDWIRWSDEFDDVVESARGVRLVVHLAVAGVVLAAVLRRSRPLAVMGWLALVLAVLWSLGEPLLIDQQSDTTVHGTPGRDAWRAAAALGAAALVVARRDAQH